MSKEISSEQARCDEIAGHNAYAQTLAHMLYDLVLADDGLPDDLDGNDPASREQRMFACVEALQQRLDGIDRALRKA